MTTNSGTNPQIRAACYCRISSDPHDKREGVDRQRADTAALCEVKGWQVAGFYVDNDRSASNGRARPEWMRLLADVEAGKIDAVAAWDQDRVNRTLDDLISYKQLFVKRGILLATSNNGDIDLSTPAGELMATIKTAVSTHEIAMMRVRMRRAGRARAECGAPKWRSAFGYAPGVDGPEPDPKTAPLVAKAYAALLAGASLGDIAKLFNTAGTFGLNGKPWTHSTVSLFMRAPRNAALRAYNGTIVGDGTWPPLIPETTWRQAQSILEAPHRKPGRKSVSRHLLTGVLACGNPGCGGHLSGNWQIQRGGNRAITYRCKRCTGLSIRAEHVEPYLYAVVAERLSRPDAVGLLKADLDEAVAEGIRRELAVLYARLESIGVDVGEGLLTGVQAKAATDTVNTKIAALERRQQDSERLRVFADLPLGEPEVADAISRLPEGRFRAVVDLLMTVTVTPVGKGSHVFTPDRVQVAWR